MSCSPVPADLSAYEPPMSLWTLVENSVPMHEREEVKNMLGESLVEQSIELHQEIELLLDIWRDYREETDHMNNPIKKLPEPPAVRERLRQEICFFVERIREKSKHNGSDVEVILSKHNTDVLEYVMDQKRPDSGGYHSRPSTAMSSRDGRDTPLCRLGTPTSDRFSQTSFLSDEVEAMNDKLNVLKLDEVITHLRETMEEEIEKLHADIRFLQDCLEDEANYRSQSSMGMEREPTLSELREERGKLEKDLLASETPIPEVLREKPANSSIHRSPLTPPGGHLKSSLKSMSAVKKSPGSATRSRPAPLKACHDIDVSSSPSTKVQVSSGQHSSMHKEPTPPAAIPQSPARRGPRLRDQENLSLAGPEQLTHGRTHLTIRMGSGSVPRSAKLMRVASVPAPQTSQTENANTDGFTPVPPSDSRPASRPSSASRFRRMVHGCREMEETPPIGGAS